MLEGLDLDDDGLLVGPASLDDAGVYGLDDDTALVQTVDFFTPLVDDPYKFGSIAAANSLSDVYAMGGTPICALSVLCFPCGTVPVEIMRDILKGGIDKIRESGAAVAGGHSVLDKEIKFGFAVTGRVHPSRIVRVSGARPGDVLVLTKPIGTGVLCHTLKAEGLAAEIESALVASMLELNAAAGTAMVEAGAGAGTDVTGFGLLGHALGMARSSGVTIAVRASDVPLLPGAREAAAGKIVPGGLKRNRRYVEPHLRSSTDETSLDLMCDPQTSGGLLVAVGKDRAAGFLKELEVRGVACAAAIGEVVARGDSYLRVE